jgi:hypothetical protein
VAAEAARAKQHRGDCFITSLKHATALILVAVLVAAGTWLNYAMPSATPRQPVPVGPAAPQPTLAPLPLGPAAPAAPAKATATDVEISHEIAPLPPPILVAPSPNAPAPPPAAKPAEEPQTNCQSSGCQYYYRRGFLRRR